MTADATGPVPSGVTNPEHEFDLSLALLLAGFSFESYNLPAHASYEGVLPVSNRWSNGTVVTYVNDAHLQASVKGWVRLTVRSASKLPKADFLGKSDPYVVAALPSDGRVTSVVPKTLDPVWGEGGAGETFFMFVRAPEAEVMTLEVWDSDKATPGKKDDLLGIASIKVSDIMAATAERGEDMSLPLSGGLSDKGKHKGAPTLHVNVRWIANTEQLSHDYSSRMSKAKTDSYLASLDAQENGKAFKELLEVAGIAAEHALEPVLYLDNQGRETQCWVFCNKSLRTICLAWRGTEQEKSGDFVTDANLVPWSFECVAEADGSVSRKDVPPLLTVKGPWVHVGFLRGWDSIRDTTCALVEELMTTGGGDSSGEPWNVWVTGHSLGGALATLCAHELAFRRWTKCPKPKVTMYSYGQPRVGNEKFVKLFTELVPNAWRICNKRDVVTNVPQMALGYRHIGNKALLDVGGSVRYKLQPGAGASAVQGEIDSDDILQQLKLDGDASGNASASAGSKSDGLKFVWGKSSAKMATIMDGSAVNDHMEDVYYSNLRGLYEKWHGALQGLAAAVFPPKDSAAPANKAPAEQGAGGGSAAAMPAAANV